VVKLLSKRWWIPIGARLEGLRAEVRFPTAYQGFSSIQGTLFDACNIYPLQARANANDKMTVLT